MKDYGHFVGGQWMPPASGEYIEVENPYNLEICARIGRGGQADVEAAIESADAAFRQGPWSKMTATQRSHTLWRIADTIDANIDTLAQLETIENGRAIADGKAALPYISNYFRYYAGLADKIEGRVPPSDQSQTFTYTQHEPYGVIAAIVPWNAPIVLMSMKVAPGLAAGNTFVIKPHEGASAAVLFFAELCIKAGLPAGVVNVVTGYGAEVGGPLVSNPTVRKIAFTGGDIVGRMVYEAAARQLKPVVLELGGKSPNIVFEDADLDKAARGAVRGMFSNAGQSCFAGSRVIVQESRHDEFVELVAKHTKALRMGDPMDPSTEIGPLASTQQLDRTMGYLDIARAEGVVVAQGGGKSSRDGCHTGYFVDPTILTGVKNSMRIAREEVFGPVMSVLTFDDEEHAIAVANDTPFGLAAGVWTENMRRAIRVSSRIEAGTVWVNTYRNMSFMSPFGGYKESGLGRENGIDAVLEYLQTKNICIGMQD